jgi:hypothetical protein
MRAIVAVSLIGLSFAGSATAQSNPGAPGRHPLEGVWSRVAGVTGGEVVANQPGFRMFVDGLFTSVRVEGLAPRVPHPATGATAAQVRAVYTPFTGQAGRYEIQSVQTAITRPEVALNPAGMARDLYGIQSYRIVGDTLWTSNVANQAGPIANPQMGKYIRVRNGGATPLDGAWRVVESRNADGTLTGNQPGIRLFKDGYTSFVRVNGAAPRPPLPDATATAEQLLAVWGPFIAITGPFEVSGQTYTERPIVSKSPGQMGTPGAFNTITYRISGDSLWISLTANQAGPVNNPTRILHLRVRPPRPPTD